MNIEKSSNPKKILIAEPNESWKEQLSKILSESDYEIKFVNTGEEALELANSWLPDIILTEIDLQKMNGIELSWMIKVNSKVPYTPVIFLTQSINPETREHIFSAGGSDYLLKPFGSKELLSKLKSILGQMDALKTERAVQKALTGRIENIPLSDVIQILTLNRKGGILKIKKDSGEKGEIYIKDDKIINAVTDDLIGEKALYKIIIWMKGQFEFEPCEVNIEPTINKGTMALIMEAMRLADESSIGDTRMTGKIPKID